MNELPYKVELLIEDKIAHEKLTIHYETEGKWMISADLRRIADKLDRGESLTE